VRRATPRRSSWCRYAQRHSDFIAQCSSGNGGASFDRNRLSSAPSAAWQHAVLLTIDTACHRLRGATGAVDCFEYSGDLVVRFHIDNFSVAAERHAPCSCIAFATTGS
jgi:hypothetical protein